MASITAALALFHEMKLPFPPATCGYSVLVWGGSTSVGQYAIQLAKASGCFVITTASPGRHSFLKELGADVCFDYSDANVVSQIKDASKNNLSYAVDCISEKGSTAKVCAALTGPNPQVATVLPGVSNEIPSNVTQRSVMMYTIFGKKMHVFGQDYEAVPADKAFAEKFYSQLTDILLPEGRLKPNKATKVPGGLNGVEEGFQRMMENKIAAEKLVYTIAETSKP